MVKRGALLFWLVGAGVLFSAGIAEAAVFNVNPFDVAGLANAINTANSNGQDDTIEVNGPYILNSALPDIAADGGHSLTIHGNSALIQRSDAAGTPNFRLFHVSSNANLTLSDLMLTNGTGSHGGAIWNDAETGTARLTIKNCTISNNSSDFGGAIFNDGRSGSNAITAVLTVTNSTFESNSAQNGGAIWSENGGSGGSTSLNISNCWFDQNMATVSAGAIQHDGSSGSASGSITNCAFSFNACGNYGGAIDVDGGGGVGLNGSAILTITNCTFDENSADRGGAIALDGSNGTSSSGNATVYVGSCTFSGNLVASSGGGIYLSENGGGTTVLQIGNTILEQGFNGDNLTTEPLNGGTATIISQGYNLSDDAAAGDTGTGPGGFLNHTGDIRNTDPMLDPNGSQNNGGPTQTIALQSTSPALDKGNRNTIPIVGIVSTDQRGEPRPFDDPTIINASGGDGSDIGAYEADVRITGSTRSGNNLQITFSTIAGHTYEVQTRTSLSSGSWTTVTGSNPAPPISGTGGMVLATVPNAFSPARGFYRIHQL